MDDAALMQRVQAGDESALASLMERWEVPVKRVVARLVLNATEAEDIAQETFARIWLQRQKFHAGAAFRPWVFAIAVNLARNRLRWWRRRPAISLEAWEGDASKSQGADLANRPERGPAARLKDEREGRDVVERNERAAAVRSAITALPIDLREAVVLFEYEQLSHAEIGAAVGCSAKAVETRLYRARALLRKTLGAKLDRRAAG